MPTWEGPPRHLLPAMSHVREDTVEKEPYDWDVRIRTIEAVEANSKYVIEGVTIGATGTVQLRAGQKIAVLYKGDRPEVVLAHSARRAQYPGAEVTSTVAIVEELFIATDPDIESGSKTDIFFRNYSQVTPLKVPLSGTPWKVFWGTNPDVFAVLTGPVEATADTYSVFRLNRPTRNVGGVPTFTKVFPTSKKVSLKEKLYEVTLSSAIALDLTTIQVNWDRNSDEGVASIDWAPGVLGPGCIFGAGGVFLDRVNHNEAHVSRSVTIHLDGTSTLSYQGTPIPADQWVDFGKLPNEKPTAFLQGVVLDANNDLIVSVGVSFNHLNMIQGNSQTGLTGSYSLLGDGVHVNGGVCFVASCPHVSDPVATQDFMDHGNPGGIVTTDTTERHSLLVNARTGALVFKTFKSNVVLDMEESTQGLTPYVKANYSGMPVIALQCYAQNFTPKNDTFVTHGPFDLGVIGAVGLTKSPRSLFDPAIAFNPDGVSREAQILLDLPSIGYDKEFTDGFGRVCGVFSNCSPAQAEVHWTSQASDVFNRYNVYTRMTPFYATSAGVLCFTTVVREASRPIGFESDPHQVAAFITVGSTVLATVLDYTTVSSIVTGEPLYVSHIGVGNDVRVFWRQDTTWKMTDFKHTKSKDIGSNVALVDDNGFALTWPDYLYAAKDGSATPPITTTKNFFVNGWNRKTFEITLSQSAPTFPPKDSILKDLGLLTGIPKRFTGIKSKHVHTINDTSVIPSAAKVDTS